MSVITKGFGDRGSVLVKGMGTPWQELLYKIIRVKSRIAKTLSLKSRALN